MKTPSKLLIATSFICAVISHSAASDRNQTSYTSATASATILRPVQIMKLKNLDFGTIIPSHTQSSVSLKTNGSITTKGKTAIVQDGQTKPTMAELTVTSEENTIVTISIPRDKIIISNGEGSTMIISNIVCESAKKELNKETFRIGATLNIGAIQPHGHYFNESDFQIMVGYN